MFNILRNLFQLEAGQDLIEYTLLLAFVVLASAALFVSAGGSISSIWGFANNTLGSAASAANPS